MCLVSYKNSIINVHLNEKLNLCNTLNNNNTSTFNVNTLKINFTLKNTSNNKIMFFTHLILIEKMVGQKLKFVYSTEHNQNFNIRKGTILGCTVTLTNKKVIDFLFLFVTYSLRKLNLLNSLVYAKPNLSKIKKKIYNNLNFSLNKILFFFTLSSHIDWDNFSYIYNETTYGLDFQLQTNFINPFINRLILSHYGLLLI
jgi:ribosomal protein L5